MRLINVRTAALAAGAMALSMAGAASAQVVYGVTQDNRLVSFAPSTPGTLTGNVAITGLGSTEAVRGIDARPLTGELFIMTSESRLYSVNPTTGAATAVGAGFTPALNPLANGHGFDFNPTVDRIRLVDSLGGNRRLNPLTGGAAATDTALTYNDGSGLTPRAVGTAYSNARFFTTAPMGSTRQFIIDSARDILGEVGSMAGGNASFNGGVVTPVGALGIDLLDNAGFDIYGETGMAYISNGTPTQSKFFALNLSTGAAVEIGIVGGGNVYMTDFTVVPAPGAAAVAGLAGVGLLRRRRR
jgi:hypothetical protein